MAETTAARPTTLHEPHERQRPRLLSCRNLRRHPRVLVSGGVILAPIRIAVCAPVIARGDPKVSRPADALQGPSAGHWLGTDSRGRDLLARVIWGSRVSLAVGLIAVGIGLTCGVLLG